MSKKKPEKDKAGKGKEKLREEEPPAPVMVVTAPPPDIMTISQTSLPPPEPEPVEPVWIRPLNDPQYTHPATIGYTFSDTGTVRWNPAKISPVFSGKVFSKIPAASDDIPDVSDPQPRERMPFKLTSMSCGLADILATQTLFLEEKVWPTLLAGIEKLMKAIRTHIPKEIRAKYDDPSMRRILNPSDAVMDPIQWLAHYLKRYNPNRPPRFTPDEAATYIQTRFRGYLARKLFRQMLADKEAQIANRLDEIRRHAAATTIQAFARGRAVREAIALGRPELVMIDRWRAR